MPRPRLTQISTALLTILIVSMVGADDKEEKPPVVQATPDILPTVFHYNFQGQAIPDDLTQFRVEFAKLFQIEPRGLHLQLPKGIHPRGGVGVWTNYGLKGDFDITATCQIIEAEKPPEGYGVGLTLKVEKENTVAGVLHRFLKPNGNDILMWVRERVANGAILCPDKEFQLRLKRVDGMLHYMWTPGLQGSDFKELNRAYYGTEDIARVSLESGNGRTSAKLDAYFLDLHIKGQKITNVVLDPSKSPPRGTYREPVIETPGRSNITLVLALAIFLVLIAAGVIIHFRRRRGDSDSRT